MPGKKFRRYLSISIAGILIAASGGSAAAQQAWPTRTIRAVVPINAGSATDIIARTVLDQLALQVGRPIVIENRGGAGGTIGANIVAKAAPDGYTILVSGTLATAHAVFPSRPYDTLSDLVPVSPLGRQPFVLVTAPSKGFKTLGKLVAAAKASPRALTFASAGSGSLSQFAAERLAHSAGFSALHVPFRGATEALTEVLTGRVDFFASSLPPALPLIRGAQIVPLAVTSMTRVATLPQTPTTTEAGYVDSAYGSWFGLFLPAHAPRQVLVRLHKEAQAAVRVPAIREKLTALGVEPMQMTLEEVERYFRDDLEAHVRLVRLVKARGQ